MTDTENEKRLIEVEMPLEEISRESRREKNIRHGHPSTMQMWWAPRPMAASRAAAYASLIHDPVDQEERDDQIEFIKQISTWEATTDSHVLSEAIDAIDQEFDGETPRTLDPFSGRGILPLESQRLGCESHALELNPVAYMINKGLMEYPFKAKQRFSQDAADHDTPLIDTHYDELQLVKDVKKYAGEVMNQVEAEIGELYEDDELVYVWARTLPCQNPECDLEIPLVSQFWLSRKQNVVYDIEADKEGDIEFRIYRNGEFEEEKEGNRVKLRFPDSGGELVPASGTVQGGSVSCPACSGTFKSQRTRELSREVGFGEQLIAVVEDDEETGKRYRLATDDDRASYQEAMDQLESLDDEWIPDEPLPPQGALGMRVNLYEYETWGDLFNTRQKLALGTFCKEVNRIYEDIASEEDEEYAEMIVTYLTFAIGKMANRNSVLSFWANNRVNHTFSTPGLPIRWDYAETNPFSGWTGSWIYSLDWIYRGIKTCSHVSGEPNVNLGTATRLPYPDDHFDAILTDPPYYDNIPYSYLADFFYVWMKRSIGEVFPEAFSTPLSPKNSEIIQDDKRHESENHARDFFEDELSNAFDQINRVLKGDGICTIVFAHKSTEAWAQMVRSLLSSGLVVTATWPIHTERHNRPRGIESAALSSSVYFVCRSRSGKEVGYYSDVEEELQERVHERLDYFWDQGIRGADILVSAIGPAVEVFGQYEDVKRLSGERVTVDELLAETQRLVSDYALEKVMDGDVNLGNIDAETRFYILYRWAFANQTETYDEVRKLAQVNDANTSQLERIGIMSVSRGNARLIPPQERNIDSPEVVPEKNHLPLVEKVHRAAILWERGQRSELKSFVEEHCMVEEFWRAAQAIAECLPDEESRSQKEKQMLHGLLNYGGQTEFDKTGGQASLNKYTDGGTQE